MEDDICIKLIKKYEKEYVEFMGIDKFPRYKLELFEIKHDEIESKDFGVVAQAKYNPLTGEHTLWICKNLEIKKYIVFHELTHILDVEMYAHRDKIRYLSLMGYMEYHASQVELMYLLGAESVDGEISKKSMGSIIETFPDDMSVSAYVLNKYKLVVDMVNSSGFPKDIETLHTTFALMYNYWGLRSICRLYVKDYSELEDVSALTKVLNEGLFSVINRIMDGWLDEKTIELTLNPYYFAIQQVCEKKKLTE